MWLHQIGYSLQRGRKKFSQADPVKQAEFIQDIKKLKTQSCDEIYLSSDEAGIQLDPTIAAQWAPKGKQPQLPSDGNRERVKLCGIVDSKTNAPYVQRIEKGNSPAFVGFLMWLWTFSHLIHHN